MAITREQITDSLNRYLVAYPADVGRLAALRQALASETGVTSRREMTGHVTAATVLVDEHGNVLHIRHKVLDKWLIPGGHLEAEDTNLAAAALRELAEETGMTGIDGEPELIDIDVHPIPANPGKREAAHQHFDFRFLARTRGRHDVALQAEEVTDYRWMPVQPTDYPAIAARLRGQLANRANAMG